MRVVILALLATLTLTACGDRNRTLHDTRPIGGSPDEFGVLPSNPLEMPEQVAVLPEPTVGVPNRADRDPISEAVVALGGNPAGGVTGDAALIAQVSRFGTNPAIRDTLATEDARFRKLRGGLGFLPSLKADRYFRAYSRYALDAYAEFERLRALGVKVPSAPPQR